MTTFSVIALLATQASGAAGASTSSANSRAQALDGSRVTAPVKCLSARKAVRWYSRRLSEHRARMGALTQTSRAADERKSKRRAVLPCPRHLAHVLQRKAYAMRVRVERWLEYHWNWRAWLPQKWQRIGACETGYGRRPGNWRHSNSSYEGAFGFAKSSWDAFKGRADRKAGPYPEDAWQATPRQQYEVALAIYRMYGLSGWGCRGV